MKRYYEFFPDKNRLKPVWRHYSHNLWDITDTAVHIAINFTENRIKIVPWYYNVAMLKDGNAYRPVLGKLFLIK